MTTTETRLMLDRIVKTAEQNTGKKWEALSEEEQVKYLADSLTKMTKE